MAAQRLQKKRTLMSFLIRSGRHPKQVRNLLLYGSIAPIEDFRDGAKVPSVTLGSERLRFTRRCC